MKFALLLSVISFSAFCQDSIRSSIQPDTVDVQREVSFTPDGVKRSIRSLPYYVVPVTDPRLREASMGMSVLNLLRGQVPGLGLTPQFVTTDPFQLNAFMVIDGAPSNSTIADVSSLNTFDYESPTVISGNAMTYYGMYGIGNGVLLNSRSGEGFNRGQFSFNTFNTRGSPLTGWSFSNGQSLYSNSLAYSKDFGAVDLRISGKYSFVPGVFDVPFGRPRETSIKDSNFKINTGWNISSKLKARLILEKASEKRESDFKSSYPDPSDRAKYDNSSSRANLNLEYNATSWLRLSSRLQKSWIDNDDKVQGSYNSYVLLQHDRNLVNLFANFDKHITRDIALSASTGYQRDKATGSLPYHINSQMNNVGVRFKDQLFLDGSFRFDNSNIDPMANNKKTWSVGSGWVFSDMLKTTPGFPYGKLRASVGRYSYPTIQYYPQVALMNGRFIESYVDNSKQYYRYEVGTDLLFWRGRVQLTANYLRFSSDLSGAMKYVEEGPLTIGIVDNTRYITDQQQVAIGAYLTGKKTAFTKLTVTTGQSKKKSPPGRAQNLTVGQPYYITLLQTSSIDDVTLNILFEGYSNTQKQNVVGVRQLSIGYATMNRFAEHRSVDPAMISLIFRNFMSSQEIDYTTNGFARSISVGFTMNF